jgi:hypothetical protein
MPRNYPDKFPRVPYQGIEFLVGRFHVGTDPHEIASHISKRIQRHSPDVTDSELAEVVRYALAVHKANRSLYRAVTAGRI